MERNDIFDLDYIVKIFHNISLIIFKSLEEEKKLNIKKNDSLSILNEKESTHMILGTLNSFSEIIKE